MRKVIAFLAAFVCLAICRFALAQWPCEMAWHCEDAIAGVDGTVYDLLSWDPDGEGPEPSLIVIGGNFMYAGDKLANNIAAWDGTNWRTFGTGTDGTVEALAVYENELYAGGGFAMADGVTVNCIARWNGSTWESLAGGMTVAGSFVYDMEVVGELLYAGGNFFSAGGVTVRSIAAWDGSMWHALGNGVQGSTAPVRAIKAFQNEIYVGGGLTSAGGVSTGRIARWDGFAWQGVGGTGFSGVVYDLTLFESELVAVGKFLTVNGATVNGVAHWNGASWGGFGTGFNIPTTSSYTPRCVNSFDGNLIVGGNLYTAGGIIVDDLAMWNGESWVSMEMGISTPAAYVILPLEYELLVGGDFNRVSGTPSIGALSIAKWSNANGWSPFTLGINGIISGFGQFRGDLVAIGDFTTIGGTSANHFALRTEHGWTNLGAEFQWVTDSIEFDDSLYVAAQVPTAENPYAGRVCRWDGTNWAFVGGEFDKVPLQFVILNGKIVVGGRFTEVSGVAANQFAEWNGVEWLTFGDGVEFSVADMIVHQGYLIAAGVSDEEGAQLIAKWDGNAWTDIGGPLIGGGDQTGIRSLTIYDGDLIAVGLIALPGTPTSRGVVRWDGSQWFGMQVTESGSFQTTTLYGDYLVVGGNMTILGGNSVRRVACWNGVSWQTIGGGSSGSVYELYVYQNELLLGGWTFSVGETLAAYWSRWSPTHPRGDLNEDGAVDMADLPDFVDAILNSTYSSICSNYLSDVNSDGAADGGDVALFVEAILGQG